MQSLNSFCEHTTLHGWQYIIKDSFNKAQKSFWALILSVCIIGATILAYNNVLIFKNATVVTTVETMTAPLNDIFFPSITVCNLNQARRSFFEEMGISDNDTLIRQILSEYLGVGEDVSNGVPLPKDLVDKLNKAAPANKSLNWAMHQKCSDMFMFSKWNGSVSESLYDVDYDFGTDYGICCWFTPQLNFTQVREEFALQQKLLSNRTMEKNWRLGQMDIDGHWFADIKKGATTGVHNGFTMFADIESFDYNYYDEGAEGLKVLICKSILKKILCMQILWLQILLFIEVSFSVDFLDNSITPPGHSRDAAKQLSHCPWNRKPNSSASHHNPHDTSCFESVWF